jgi:hypothetical protein
LTKDAGDFHYIKSDILNIGAFMTIVYVIIGGAVGGVLGWLFDRLSGRHVTPVAEDATRRT